MTHFPTDPVEIYSYSVTSNPVKDSTSVINSRIKQIGISILPVLFSPAIVTYRSLGLPTMYKWTVEKVSSQEDTLKGLEKIKEKALLLQNKNEKIVSEALSRRKQILEKMEACLERFEAIERFETICARWSLLKIILDLYSTLVVHRFIFHIISFTETETPFQDCKITQADQIVRYKESREREVELTKKFLELLPDSSLSLSDSSLWWLKDYNAYYLPYTPEFTVLNISGLLTAKLDIGNFPIVLKKSKEILETCFDSKEAKEMSKRLDEAFLYHSCKSEEEQFLFIRKRIEENRPVLLSSGCRNHVVMTEILLQKNNRYTVRIYNSGAGLGRHECSFWEDKPKTMMEYKDVEFSDEQLKELIASKSGEEMGSLYQWSPLRELTPSFPGPFQKGQEAGNCSLECIMAYLRNNLREDQYTLFKGILLHLSLEQSKEVSSLMRQGFLPLYLQNRDEVVRVDFNGMERKLSKKLNKRARQVSRDMKES